MAVAGPAHPADPSALPFAAQSREAVVSLVPFTVRRVARWSECDPAGVVYTGHFAEYLLSAVHLFRLHLFGSWQEVRRTFQLDLPAKAISLVFNGALWPDDVFDMVLHVGEIRTRTFDVVAAAHRHDGGGPVFEGRMSSICVSADDRTAAVPLPQDLRARLLDIARASPAPGHLLDVS